MNFDERDRMPAAAAPPLQGPPAHAGAWGGATGAGSAGAGGAGIYEMARLGAVVGATGAAAANLHRLQQREVSGAEAAMNTARVGVASGLATVAATLVARQFRSPTLALAATLVTGTAAMYALNSPAPRPHAARGEPETDATDSAG